MFYLKIREIRYIIRRLRNLNVALAYLFGSSVLGTRGGLSDIDIGIVTLGTQKSYLDLYDSLYNLFSELYPKEEIDIVFLDRAPLVLRFEVVTTGKVLYRISKEFEYNYKERVIKEYIDIKPLLEIQDRILLERI